MMGGHMTSKTQPPRSGDPEAGAFGRAGGRRHHASGLPQYYAIKAVAEALDVSHRTIRGTYG
jgi:hypothetical protein